ncbi:NAD(P)H-hydrate epimerase [Arthrobacter roseus]|uniref:NAD(P)H-hydrate epimerase n=1 Tax=Arthrobacter roseus TaxID=136274 RepID=UPI0019625C72|nr:NAD(P)H-hydrate epimerase [Arthrobacter roseus]MBM7849276.1 hydroxyethylthiazole kinase-like uncharacterized protein yjeF [Arthrobacter roseus]
MIAAYTAEQVRAAEAPLLAAGPDGQLMRRAAHGLYAKAVELIAGHGGIYGARAAIIVGSGNNGGDALYAGALLSRRGIQTTAILTSERVHESGLAEFQRSGGTVIRLQGDDSTHTRAVRACLEAALVIDGILGIGAHGGLREPARGFVEALNCHAIEVLACDLPSGVDPSTGEVEGPVLQAKATTTFGAAKSGLMAGPGALAAGTLDVVDIGVPFDVNEADVYRLELGDLAALYPVPGPTDHKYSRGVLGISAGSPQYPGAALLSCGGALATGVGMVRYLGPDAVSDKINLLHPEVVCSSGDIADEHVQAWLVGPGIGEDSQQVQRARDAVGSGLPVVADASALKALQYPLHDAVILTPHAGELSGIFEQLGQDVTADEIKMSPLKYAREAAKITGATVLLKGHATVVACPAGTTFSQSNSTPWLATAGTGDTLAGILGALTATMAEGPNPATALGLPDEARWAVISALAAMLHGMAGQLADDDGPLSSSGLPQYVRTVLSRLPQNVRARF